MGVHRAISYSEIGRPVSWHWRKSGGTTIIEFRYAHDREGNRWYKRIISPAIGGEYGTDSVELYRYDGVYRVTGVKYGVNPTCTGTGFCNILSCENPACQAAFCNSLHSRFISFGLAYPNALCGYSPL